MYVKINKPEGHNSNKSGCNNLIEYLQKEDNYELQKADGFFNLDRNHISGLEAESIIDKNVKNLGKKDSKFFHISINPSQKELRHIVLLVSHNRVGEAFQLTPMELQNFNAQLQYYTHNVMDGYAKNFNRGLEGKDIVYVAKIETTRKYDRFSNEVKHNQEVKKTGNGAYLRNSKDVIITENMYKDGMNYHIHVVVSRKDKTNTIKLSPFANARNAKNKLGGREVQIGFDRKAFVGDTEQRFDHQFNYNRSYKNSFEYKYAVAHQYNTALKQVAKQQIKQAIGNPKQDLLRELGLEKGEQFTAQTRQLINIISKGIAPQKLVLDVTKQVIRNILSI